MNVPLQILLVEDSEFVRFALRSLLEGKHPAEFRVAGEIGSVEEARRWPGTPVPHVVLLDLRLPDGNGLDLIPLFRGWAPRPRILVLTSVMSDDVVLRTIAAGADGFLLKDTTPDRLIEAVRKLGRGESVLDEAMTQKVFNWVRGDAGGDDVLRRVKSLSPQEHRVMALLSAGRTNKEIGASLGLSENTVKNYLVNAFEKLGVRHRAQAAVLYAKYEPGGSSPRS